MNQKNRTALITASALAFVMGFASARAETTRSHPHHPTSLQPHATNPPKNMSASDAQNNFLDLKAAQRYVCVSVGDAHNKTLILKDSPKPPLVFEGQFFTLQVFFDRISKHPESPDAQKAVKRVTELLSTVPPCVKRENDGDRPKIRVRLTPSAPSIESQIV